MRNRFAQKITQLAKEDDRIVLLSGDIGNRLFDPFKLARPSRFLNCGVAEQNMTGVAAGLAKQGFLPFTYTIAPFCTTRCLERINTNRDCRTSLRQSESERRRTRWWIGYGELRDRTGCGTDERLCVRQVNRNNTRYNSGNTDSFRVSLELGVSINLQINSW